MSEPNGLAITNSQKIHPFRRVIQLFIRPRNVFMGLETAKRSNWLLPMALLTLTILGNVVVSGWIKQQNINIDEGSLPADFEYYTPEQQAQYLQAAQATTGPVFVYILPAIASTLGLWLSWLIISALLHLLTTLLGGRSDMNMAFNISAWSRLPLALRDIIRIISMLITRKLIDNPGLSGFSPSLETSWGVLSSQLLSLIDIYIVWMAGLIILAVSILSNIHKGKPYIVGIISVLVILIIQAFLGFAAYQLGNLTVIRPFFF